MARRNITIAEDETQAVKDQMGRKLVREFDMSERKLIRYALLNIGSLLDISEKKDDTLRKVEQRLASMESIIADAMEKVVDLTKETRGRKVRTSAKPTIEEAYDEGRLICEELGGIIQANMCLYKVYEVAANGRPYANERGLDLSVLNQRVMDEQYSPSKEAYDAAVIKYNSTVN